jgi:hypothetical protein
VGSVVGAGVGAGSTGGGTTGAGSVATSVSGADVGDGDIDGVDDSTGAGPPRGKVLSTTTAIRAAAAAVIPTTRTRLPTSPREAVGVGATVAASTVTASAMGTCGAISGWVLAASA